MMITHASRLTDAELVLQVAQLARGERAATVALIVHLAEFDARRLFAPAGFPSTFAYCLDVLQLSEDATFNRIEAARLARKYPMVVDMLQEGALSPTTARMLSRHVTPDNHEALFAATAGKSKREVEKLLAGLFPKAEAPASVRAIPAANVASDSDQATGLPAMPRAEAASASAAIAVTADHANDDAARSVPSRPPVAGATAPRGLARPLSADRYEIRFTANGETHEKLRRAQDLLGHAVPGGDLAHVFDRALTLLVADLERKKCAATPKPGKSREPSADSRHIPAAVRRAVWIRDHGQCAFVSASGRRCDARRCLEYHHVKPFAAGGRATVENIQLRCRAHNRYEAEAYYGPLHRDAGENPPVPERVRIASALLEGCRTPWRGAETDR
jgi:hypothetical protein